MSTKLKWLLPGLFLALSLTAFDAGSARADDYWGRHWGWYDNTYRPYYQRRYSTPYYGNRYYGPTYYPPQTTYYYSQPRSYYVGPGPFGGYYGGGPGNVQVGPLQFGWW